MMDAGRLAALVLASVVLIAVPGPSVLFVVGRSLAYGRRVALLSVVGNAAGIYAAAAVVAVGLGPILQRSEGLLLAVKLAGALYLAWLGVQALRTRHRPLDAPPEATGPVGSTWAVLRQGAWVGVLNPKALIFFTAFLPQFVQPEALLPVPLQLLALALVPVAVALVSDSLWGLAAAGARSWFATDPRRLTWTTRGGGTLMIALGGSLATDATAQR